MTIRYLENDDTQMANAVIIILVTLVLLGNWLISLFRGVVVLSSTARYRKPAPEIFWAAARALNIEPARCAYIGDRISRDVVGARRAGFAQAILIEARGAHTEPRDGAAQPDAIIHSLSELLEIFPPIHS